MEYGLSQTSLICLAPPLLSNRPRHSQNCSVYDGSQVWSKGWCIADAHWQHLSSASLPDTPAEPQLCWHARWANNVMQEQTSWCWGPGVHNMGIWGFNCSLNQAWSWGLNASSLWLEYPRCKHPGRIFSVSFTAEETIYIFVHRIHRNINT